MDRLTNEFEVKQEKQKKKKVFRKFGMNFQKLVFECLGKKALIEKHDFVSSRQCFDKTGSSKLSIKKEKQSEVQTTDFALPSSFRRFFRLL